MQWEQWLSSFVSIDQLSAIAWKVLGALIMYVVGRWVISLISKVVRRTMRARDLDLTLQSYISSIITVALNILLVISILGQFGVQTTSFAALLAAAGLAIGTAWGGLLANFAAGAFLLIFRPFKAGDVISAAGVTGMVDTIGMFATELTTPDNVKIIVGNNKLFADNIVNYTAKSKRRVDRNMQLAHSVDLHDAQQRLLAAVTAIPTVIADPAPAVFVFDLQPAGPVLQVRAWCNTADYWTTYEAVNLTIKRTAVEAGYPAPAMPIVSQ